MQNQAGLRAAGVLGADEMAQQVKESAAKPEGLSLIGSCKLLSDLYMHTLT